MFPRAPEFFDRVKIMKKLTILFLAVFLLWGCAAEPDPRTEEIRQQIMSLPTAEELTTMSLDDQQEVYYKTQEIYDAFQTLVTKEQEKIPEAQEIFSSLFGYFNSLVMPLMETEEAVTIPEEPEPTVAETTLPDVVMLTEEEKQLLLKLGMAERGDTGCVECTALVMNTVLNRLSDSRFPSTIRNIIYAQDQFTPVMDGSFEKAKPNELCKQALEMVIKGWDESQGALYYEWCEGESWHSRNLELLLQHCDTRFYK